MYIPAANKIEDRQKAFELIENHGFATLITQTAGAPWASHLPVLLDANEGTSGQLRSHMARANVQWQHFDPSEEVLTIFHGPHSYISPSWYVSQETVPTWNYATVHVYGYPKIETDRDFVRQIVSDTTSKYENMLPNPWRMELPEATIDALLKALVGFTISISRIETKFKLGQNRSSEDQAKMLNFLETSEDKDSQALAAFIKMQK